MKTAQTPAADTVAIQKVRGDRWGVLARTDRSHAFELVQVLKPDAGEEQARGWALWWQAAIADKGLEAARDALPAELARITAIGELPDLSLLTEEQRQDLAIGDRIPRPCSSCGRLALARLTPHQLESARRANTRPESTTIVCHPILGGCNAGFAEEG